MQDILSLLRFVTDSETWRTIGRISKIASRQRNWRSEIRTVKATFTVHNFYQIDSFANFLLSRLKEAGVSNEKIEKFQIVFNELVDNAFRHGCKGAKRCVVRIRCTFSRWFIRLEVSDSGKGFNLEQALEQSQRDGVIHGLNVVDSICYELRTNRKGNVVIAFIAGQDHLGIIPVVENYKGVEILRVVIQDSAWHVASLDWKPLVHAVENAKQVLVLVDFSKSFIGTTARLRELSTMVEGKSSVDDYRRRSYPGNLPPKFYAVLVRPVILESFASHLETSSFKFFKYDEEDKAKDWLLEQAGKVVCTYPPRPVVSPSLPVFGNISNEVICPTCGQLVNLGNYCSNCGSPLNQPASVAVLSEKPPLSTTSQQVGTVPVSGYLIVWGTEISLPIPDKGEVLVGRTDPLNGIFPDIDLTPYGGDEGGVSRRHARLFTNGKQVFIEDLGSTNYTFLNQQRLIPGQLYLLTEGDLIQMGLLRLIYVAGIA